MLEPQPTERQSTATSQARMWSYLAGMLVLAAVILGATQLSRTKWGSDKLPIAALSPDQAPQPPERIDVTKIPAADDDVAHARWSPALDDVVEMGRRDYSAFGERIETGELAKLPFAEARGRVFEVEGTIDAMTAEVRGEGSLLWVVVLDGADGQRVLALTTAFASDPNQGRPEDAIANTTEYLEVGDRVIARGIYLQRRTGTFAGQILRKAAPVLVATPSGAAFKKVFLPEAPISDPGAADWSEVKDRFLGDTQRISESALFQMIAWARRQGHDAIAKDIRDGKLHAEMWDQDVFDRWSKEVSETSSDVPRPFTKEARGKLWRTRGLVADVIHQGWTTTPRLGSSWGVNELDILDLYSDNYGNKVIRTISAFPFSAYHGLTGNPEQHVEIYGYFLKNYTYETPHVNEQGDTVILTMPLFIVVDARLFNPPPSVYRSLIWFISAGILVLAVLFYFVLIRGERREAARMDAYRTGLRRRIRAHAKEAAAGEAIAPGSVQAPPADEPPSGEGAGP